MTDSLAAVENFGRAFDAKDVDAVMAAMTADCVFVDTAPPDGERHDGAAAECQLVQFIGDRVPGRHGHTA